MDEEPPSLLELARRASAQPPAVPFTTVRLEGGGYREAPRPLEPRPWPLVQSVERAILRPFPPAASPPSSALVIAIAGLAAAILLAGGFVAVTAPRARHLDRDRCAEIRR